MRLIFLLLFPLGLSAQVLTDDFSDGDLQDPDWQGQIENFAVENEQLRLMAPDGGTSLIYLPARTSIGSAVTSWEWLVQLDFAPSASNYAEVRLTVDPTTGNNDDLGYAVRVGGISGDQDALVLYRIENGISNPLITATAGAVGADPAVARIRLSRTSSGEWTLEADYAGGTNLQTEGTATDATHPILAYFGWNAVYTSTRRDLVFFDDLHIEPIVADTEPPRLLSFELPTADQISLSFSEAIEAANGENTDSYTLMGTDAPSLVSASIRPAEVQIIDLQLGSELTPLENYSLNISGLQDEAGNLLSDTTVQFTYRPILEPDINRLLLTEIMADPTPEVGLPNAEYIEIYNTIDLPIQLAGLELSSGGSPQVVGVYVLEPGEYVLIVDDGDASSFNAATPLTTVGSFPGLTNGGDVVTLTYAGRVLDEVRYDASWYDDSDRSDGGYSLERIGVDTTVASDCAGRWRASLANAGGTPGAENSVNMQAVETDAPQIVSVSVNPNEADLIRLDLDEAVAEDGSLSSFSISFAPAGIGVSGVDLNGTVATVFLDTELLPNIAYEVTFVFELSDCLGNSGEVNQTFVLGLP
ncbi:MAG: Ig-like domain-containing protein, partial [Bacteroidota bacterium]